MRLFDPHKRITLDQQRLADKLLNSVRSGNLDGVKFYLGKGADPDSRDKHSGMTALILAVSIDIPTVATSISEHLISIGADIDAADMHGNTPLMEAALRNLDTIVKLLLNRGAKVDSQNKMLRTALMKAAVKGNLAVTFMLLEHGADPWLKDHCGRRALDDAKDNNRSYVENVLMQSMKKYQRLANERMIRYMSPEGGARSIRRKAETLARQLLCHIRK